MVTGLGSHGKRCRCLGQPTASADRSASVTLRRRGSAGGLPAPAGERPSPPRRRAHPELCLGVAGGLLRGRAPQLLILLLQRAVDDGERRNLALALPQPARAPDRLCSRPPVAAP
jgi:hypothetical protein